MKTLHLTVGITLLIIFLASGQYMAEFVPELDAAPRMAWRANHIYILMIALTHLLLGVYVTTLETKHGRWMQWGGSLLMLLAAPLAIIAFFIDTTITEPLNRFYSLFAVIAVFAGVLLHGVSVALSHLRNWWERRK